MNKTPIEWCRTYRPDGSYEEGFTTNPVRFLPKMDSYLPNKPPTVTMCQKVSPGCAHCYAESIVRRFWPKAAGKFPGYTAQGVASGQFVLNTAELEAILRHRKPCRLFWGDMTDLFQDAITDEFLDRCFAVCALTPHITHIFLTKRPERMLKYLSDTAMRGMGLGHDVITRIADRADVSPISIRRRWPLPNVWLGVSVENQAAADERIPLLLQTPAAVRFISAEPLLGALDLTRLEGTLPDGQIYTLNSISDYYTFNDELRRLDWVIAGGESGRDARPMHPDWARSLRDQCQAAGVSFFFKQHGEWISLCDYDPFVLGKDTDKYAHQFAWKTGAENSEELPISCFRVGKKAAGAVLDGREWREFPEARA